MVLLLHYLVTFSFSTEYFKSSSIEYKINAILWIFFSPHVLIVYTITMIYTIDVNWVKNNYVQIKIVGMCTETKFRYR